MNEKFLYTPRGDRTLGVIHTGSVASVKALEIYAAVRDFGFKVQSIIPTQSSFPFIIESFLRQYSHPSKETVRQTLSQETIISQEKFIEILGKIGGEQMMPYIELFRFGEKNLASCFGTGIREIAHITASRVGSILVAPATVNILAKIVSGETDSFALEVVRAFNPQNGGKVFIAPAMNTQMLRDPATQKILSILNSKIFSKKYVVFGTQKKILACGETGYGAMLSPKDIVFQIQQFYKNSYIQPGTSKVYGENDEGKQTEEGKKRYRQLLAGENTCFPLKGYRFQIPTGSSQNAFGGKRKHDIHTGVDLFADEGERVFSILDGEVIHIENFTGGAAVPSSPWWNETKAVFVKTKVGMVLYGEIIPSVQVGDKLSSGQEIGKLKTVLKEKKDTEKVFPPCMLHIELYDENYPVHNRGGVWSYRSEGEYTANSIPQGLKNPTPLLEVLKEKRS